jgi:uncharacterized repeat protein (TIGR01451 family)
MKLQVKVAVVVLGALALTFAGVGLAAPSGSSDLRVSKSDSPDPVSVGSTLTYAIQVDNLGPDAATGVTVTDQLPKGVDLVSAVSSLGPCASKGRKVTCELGRLGAPTIDYGGPVTVTLTVIPRRLGTIINTASVKGDQKDSQAANNKATATTSVVGPPLTCRGIPATIVGTAADNTIVGGGGRDVIAALGGNDTVVSQAGRDLICAGGGNDHVGSGSAADRVFGGTGSDRLLGRGGPDVLMGNAGNDLLKGNRGADRLRGGRNLDRCFGGAGADSLKGCER